MERELWKGGGATTCEEAGHVPVGRCVERRVRAVERELWKGGRPRTDEKRESAVERELWKGAVERRQATYGREEGERRGGVVLVVEAHLPRGKEARVSAVERELWKGPTKRTCADVSFSLPPAPKGSRSPP